MTLLLLICALIVYTALGWNVHKILMRRHLVRNIESHRYSPEIQKVMKMLLEEAYDEY
jgi:hypothetical protein